MSEKFLSLKNVSKNYVGVQALNSVDFEVKKGEIHCLVGENGSGKSTLIKIISGVVRADNGAVIEIEGERFRDFQAIDSIRKGIEVIYQDLSLFPNLTVAENIALGEIIATGTKIVDWRKIRRIASSAMDKINTTLPLNELVENISLADQQLVAMIVYHSFCKFGHRSFQYLDNTLTTLQSKIQFAIFPIFANLHQNS